MILNDHGEVPRRLAATREVAQQLWLSSGNRCAFDLCNEVIMDPAGTLLGEVAHIRSPVPEGPRWDRSYSNEQCRAFRNLMVLCRKHHAVIDKQQDEWTVARLEQMKASHEQIYTGAVEQLRQLVGDITDSDVPQKAQDGLKVLMAEDGWTDDQRSAYLREVNELCDALRDVPIDARSTLALLIRVASDGIGLPIEILMGRADSDAVLDHLRTLEYFKIIDIDVPDPGAEYPPGCQVARNTATQPAP